MIKLQLRQLLESRHMTQAELAEATHIRPSTISDLCNNVAERFKFSHLEAICLVLNCDISDILKLI
ncbi:helix-turn-helix transcriptional regulator [Ruminococcus sp. Marseille-P6503]|uniref:helix-turn-helix domain-containing protein n=1 Tax=Ruminococcus sp. Marseille-P6503 TaxID=2364796 RepID=UPI000F535DFE|nr:helix-turn-helix transcriptional regulator [Ruminococcus sp. Marseille-P6503]